MLDQFGHSRDSTRSPSDMDSLPKQN